MSEDVVLAEPSSSRRLRLLPLAVWWFTITVTGATSGIQVSGHSQAWPTLAECEERRGAAISLLSTTLAVSDLLYGVSGCEEQVASSLRQPGKGQ